MHARKGNKKCHLQTIGKSVSGLLSWILAGASSQGDGTLRCARQRSFGFGNVCSAPVLSVGSLLQVTVLDCE